MIAPPPQDQPGWFAMDPLAGQERTFYAEGGFTHWNGLAQPVVGADVMQAIMADLSTSPDVEVRRWNDRYVVNYFDGGQPNGSDTFDPRDDHLYAFLDWAVFTRVPEPLPVLAVSHPMFPDLTLRAYGLDSAGVPTVPASSVTTWLQAVTQAANASNDPMGWKQAKDATVQPAPRLFYLEDREGLPEATFRRDVAGHYRLVGWGAFTRVLASTTPPARTPRHLAVVRGR